LLDVFGSTDVKAQKLALISGWPKMLDFFEDYICKWSWVAGHPISKVLIEIRLRHRSVDSTPKAGRHLINSSNG